MLDEKEDMAKKITDKSCSMIFFSPDNLLDYIFLKNRTLLITLP